MLAFLVVLYIPIGTYNNPTDMALSQNIKGEKNAKSALFASKKRAISYIVNKKGDSCCFVWVSCLFLGIPMMH